MRDLVSVSIVNKTLARLYGHNFKGEALFRVVWSSDQREQRLGTFDDYYHDVIYLRTVTCMRDVLKYSYLGALWVLERWIPGQFLEDLHDEVPHTRGGSYEPIYAFSDASGNALPLNEDVAKAIIESLKSIISPAERRSLDATEQATKEAKAREQDLLLMEEASPYLAGKLHGHEGVAMRNPIRKGNIPHA